MDLGMIGEDNVDNQEDKEQGEKEEERTETPEGKEILFRPTSSITKEDKDPTSITSLH